MSKENSPSPYSPAASHTGAKDALIVVAKKPSAGQTKTRLAPPLSLEQAASLYEGFLRDTLDLMRQVPGVQPVIAYLPAEAQAYFQQLAPDFHHFVQEGCNLGSRLDHALTRYLNMGYQSAVIMNSDSPTLPARFLCAAFDALAGDADVVLGPCDDGGYYLIGMKCPAPRLLREVHMSTPTVAAETLALAAAEGLKVSLLPAWYDVDDSASFEKLLAELEKTPHSVASHTRSFLDRYPQLKSS